VQLTAPFQDAGVEAFNSSGCRNDIALQRGWATHPSALGLQTQQDLVSKTLNTGTDRVTQVVRATI
jgi:hypothetical protein